MYLHTTVLLPVCIGNLWGFAMPAQVNGLFSDYLVMMCTEAIYRSEDSHFLLRLVKRSTMFRTALFMTMSAAILHTNRKLKTSDVVWFIQTFRRKKVVGSKGSNGSTASAAVTVDPSPLFDRLLPVERHVCEHPGSCDAYVLQGVQNNLKIGLCIELSRFVIDNMMRLRRSPGLLWGVLGQLKLRVIGFFIGYTTVYRVSGRHLRTSNSRHAFQNSVLSDRQLLTEPLPPAQRHSGRQHHSGRLRVWLGVLAVSRPDDSVACHRDGRQAAVAALPAR